MIKIAWAFGLIPVLVFKWTPPGDFRGYTNIFTLLILPLVWVRIHPDYWNDKHILEHELQHVEDYLRFPWLYWFRYQKPVGRLYFESRAYARQYVSYGVADLERLTKYVNLIQTRYKLVTHFSRKEIAAKLDYEIQKLETGT